MSSEIEFLEPIEHFPTPKLVFLGEQDGVPERRLKNAVSELLRRDRDVTRAYLARVVYDGKINGVILGLLTEYEDSEKLIKQISDIFKTIFNADAQLDMIFLSDEQNAAISRVCPAFYERPA
jgi:SseB protein C-terminal domain